MSHPNLVRQTPRGRPTLTLATPAAHGAPAGGALTLWTDATELLLEHPPLVVGAPCTMFAHLTALADCAPVRSGRILMHFRPQGGGTPVVAAADAPLAAGVFGAAPTFERPGVYDLDITVQSEQLYDRVAVAGLVVHASAADLPRAADEAEDGRIGLAKEEQWRTPGFRVARAVVDGISAAFDAPATIVPAEGRYADVASPVSGVLEAGGPLPRPGARVTRGQTLAVVVSLGAEGGRIAVRSPMAGIVTGRALAPGARVAAGAPLCGVVDPTVVWLSVEIPAAQAFLVGASSAASFRVGNDPRRYEARRLIAVGSVVDPATRALPVLFEVPNGGGALEVGRGAWAQVRTGRRAEGVVVPASAVLDEDGRAVAYVQAEAEAFERRSLRLGGRAGDRVLVLEGIEAGERVVTGGAQALRARALA